MRVCPLDKRHHDIRTFYVLTLVVARANIPGADFQRGRLERAHPEGVYVDRCVGHHVVVGPLRGQDVKVSDVFAAGLHVPVNDVRSYGPDLDLEDDELVQSPAHHYDN